MTGTHKFQIELRFVQDLEEFVSDDVKQGGVPKSWENMVSLVQDLMSDIRQENEDSDVFSGLMGEVLEDECGWGCGSDSRNPKVVEWELKGYEYASHAWVIFELERATEEWATFWPEFTRGMMEFNELAGDLGRLVIESIYFGDTSINPSKAELQEIHALLESLVKKYPESGNTPQVNSFLSVVRNPAEMKEFRSFYLGELLACMPNLPSLHDVSLVDMIETQLKNEVFEFHDTGFWNLVWLAKEIDLTLYED